MWTVVAVDVSADALRVAQDNARALSSDVQLIHCDITDNACWTLLGSFDVIVSNPPYIPPSDLHLIDESVSNFEPGVALFSPSAIFFYEKLVDLARQNLNPGGQLLVECNERYTNELAQLFGRYFSEVERRKDLQGKFRMMRAANLQIS